MLLKTWEGQATWFLSLKCNEGKKDKEKCSAAGYFCMVERYHSLFLAVILK